MGDGERLDVVSGPQAAPARPAGPAGAGVTRVDGPAESTPGGHSDNPGPVATVVVDTGLAHLDRPFEYSVPAEMSASARPGVRVKVRFAGRDLDGFVLARSDRAEHTGRLRQLRRIVSDEVVLTPEVLAAARAVADRYAGTLGDVLRLAVPPRHARAEKALPVEPPGGDADDAPVGSGDDVDAPAAAAAWDRYAAGPAFLRRVRSGEGPWAAWTSTPATAPDRDWPRALAEAAAAARSGGRGTIIVVPDHRDVVRVAAELRTVLGAAGYVTLTANQGPQARYTAFLKVLRGHVRVVVGTRAAAFAPVRDLGLVAWWDDGDDLHEEPRAPYPHVREVLLTRARLESTALLAGGFARSTSVQLLVEEGSLRPVQGLPAQVRRSVPRVVVAGEGMELERDPVARSARLPSIAWRAAHTALEEGPVLVQVPRRGYLPSVSCRTCRRPARCPACHGPLALTSPSGPPTCRWCGRTVASARCPDCGDSRLRASVVGARRTAEELGRAFPGVPVHTSGGAQVLEAVSGEPSLVIATPGAEPVAEAGFAAGLLLDAWALLDLPGLRAGEESVRRWLAAAALVRGAAEGGVVVLCGVPDHTTLTPVEAVVRWDVGWFAGRELAERRELRLPPAVWMARLEGDRHTLDGALEHLDLGADVEVLGPLPIAHVRPRGRAQGSGDTAPHTNGAEPAGSASSEAAPSQVLLRTSRESGPGVAARLAALKAARSARKESDGLRIQVDPPEAMA